MSATVKKNWKLKREKYGYLLKGSVERGVCKRVHRYHLCFTEYDSHGKTLSYCVFTFGFGVFFGKFV